MKKITTVKEYLANLPAGPEDNFRKLRQAALDAAPNAEEYISYGMPALKLNGPLVYYAAFKNHCSLFPGNARFIQENFQEELEGYVTTKGTIQFPNDQRLPITLIKRIVKVRAKENSEKTGAKKK